MKNDNWIEKLRYFTQQPIQMRRCVKEATYGFFFYSSAQYEFFEAKGMEEAVQMSNKGWEYVKGMDWYFSNVALYSARALEELYKESNPSAKP